MKQLPPTQRAVLFQASTGKTNAEIAEALGMAVKTVKAHKYVARKVLGDAGFRKAIFRNA